MIVATCCLQCFGSAFIYMRIRIRFFFLHLDPEADPGGPKKTIKIKNYCIKKVYLLLMKTIFRYFTCVWFFIIFPRSCFSIFFKEIENK